MTWTDAVNIIVTVCLLVTIAASLLSIHWSRQATRNWQEAERLWKEAANNWEKVAENNRRRLGR